MPAVLVMHGWGGNVALMVPVVPPLHTAGFAVLLIDARRLQTASADAQLLPVAGDHDLREALMPHADKLVDFFTRAFHDLRTSPGKAA